jgi:anti-anti-sigma regulatory factor
MAPNFSIGFQKRNGNLHLTPRGDLDGSSAYELCNALERNCNDNRKIFVDMNGLRQILPFGVDVLQGQLSSLRGKLPNIIFTGQDVSTLESKGT